MIETEYLKEFVNNPKSKYNMLAKEFHFNFDDITTASFIVNLLDECYDKDAVLDLISFLLKESNLKNKHKILN